MKILIIGCGAVGSYYGAKLQQGGAEVTALMRQNNEEVTKNGILVKSPDSQLQFKPKIINKIEQYQDEADAILICTKVLPEISLSQIIEPAIKEKTAIVLIQNGIHIEEDLRQKFPDNEIIRGLAFICVSKESPNFVNHQDYGHLVIGKYPKGTSDKCQKLTKIWQNSGIDCKNSANIKGECWKKLVWNAPFNPLSVIANKATTKQLLEDKESKDLVINIMSEIVKLAKIDGCNLEDDLIANMISYTQTMTPYKTSMLLDYENNRPLEIEAIIGNATNFARKNQTEVPHLDMLYAILRHFAR